MALKPLAPHQAAVFIDKDGTLIHDRPFNVDPERIRLRADAAPALRKLQNAGYRLFLISNQSGVARGHFDEAALLPVWKHLTALLAAAGVTLTDIYYCPHHPQGSNPPYARACTCRKPQPGMLLRAADEHDLDLSASWMIGDILDDVEAGRRAGCRTVLLDVGSETEWVTSPLRTPHVTARSFSEAAAAVLEAQPLARMPHVRQQSSRIALSR